MPIFSTDSTEQIFAQMDDGGEARTRAPVTGVTGGVHNHHHHHRHHHRHNNHRTRFDNNSSAPVPHTSHGGQRRRASSAQHAEQMSSRSDCSDEHRLEGLSWQTARQLLWSSVDGLLDAKKSQLPSVAVTLARVLRTSRSHVAFAACIVVLALGQTITDVVALHNKPGDSSSDEWSALFFLLVNWIFNVVLEVSCLMKRDRETVNRLENALAKYRASMDEAISFSPLLHPGSPLPPSLKQGSSLVSIYTVFRDRRWQRVPALMLVRGDLIALGTGDIVPAKVAECSTPWPASPSVASGAPAHRTRQGSWGHAGMLQELPAGARVEFRPEKRGGFQRKCTIPATSRSLLVLCGDMRCFRLLETPIVDFLKTVLNDAEASSTEPLVSKHLRVAYTEGIKALACLVLILMVVESLRMVRWDRQGFGWSRHLLTEPACLALFGMPVSGPALAFIAEAISVARLLTVLEKLQLAAPAGTKGHASAPAPSFSDSPSHPSSHLADINASGELDHSEHSGVMLHAGHSASAGATPRLDELDADQRIKLKSLSAAQGRISAYRYGQYLLAVVRARLHLPCLWRRSVPSSKSHGGPPMTPPHHHAVQVDHGQHMPITSLPLLPVPLMQTRAVERLGTVTMLSMVDDDLVCESHCFPEEVFLLNSKENHDTLSTNLRIAHDMSGAHKGARLKFEDPYWWKHMPSLKPIGFACMTTDHAPPRSDPVHGQDSESGLRLASADEALISHVTRGMPQRSLEALGMEVGFCAMDLSGFKERRRIHVLAPHLVDARVAEDTHALGLEETRARGALQPHVTCVILEDSRHGGMQLLAAGTPALALPMCFDYWDGRVITALSAEDRRSILDTYQQWTLEDFEVSALTYTPVPVSLPQRVGSAHEPSMPIYMVDNYTEAQQQANATAIREQANRERQATLEKQAQLEKEAEDDQHGNGRHAAADVDDSAGTEVGLSQTVPTQATLALPPTSRLSPGLADSDVPDMSARAQDGAAEDGAVAFKAETETGVQADVEGEAAAPLRISSSHVYAISEPSVLSTAPSPGLNVTKVTATADDLPAVPREPFPHKFPRSHSYSLLESSRMPLRPSLCKQYGISRSSLGLSTGSEGSAGLPLNDAGSDISRSATGSPMSLPDDDMTYKRNQAHLNEAFSRQRSHQPSTLGPSANAQGPTLTRGRSFHESGDEHLWGLLQKQVFLGMVATSVLPKREMPGFVEDMMAAGVRFIYFSPRNMRRTKALAEKLGIETDWNCAISLRRLHSDAVDEYRIQGSGIYGDWDVKARLPHGVEAIKEHLEHVDNVPLLVSLFTDSTPSTIDSMFGIFHDYSESVMCVGCASRATNAQLFRRADLSVSIEGLPGLPKLSALPTNSPHRLSVPDATFNEDVISLFCAFSLRHGTYGAKDHRASSTLLVDLIREGRRVLNNLYQMATVAVVMLTTTVLLMVCGHFLPVALPSMLSLHSVLWLLWVVLPALTLPLLDTPADSAILTRCPRKNTIKSTELRRAVGYLCMRCVPTVMACLYVHVRGLASMLRELSLLTNCRSDQETGRAWLGMLVCGAVLRPSLTESVKPIVAQAEDLTLSTLVLLLTVQTAGLLYRTHWLTQENPFRNMAWVMASAVLLCLQAMYLALRAVDRGGVKHFGAIMWDVWVVIVVSPILVLALGEYVKLHDRRIFNRFQTLLRLEFNTRLGTHSPR